MRAALETNAGVSVSILPELPEVPASDGLDEWLSQAKLFNDVCRLFYGYLGAYRAFENIGFISLRAAMEDQSGLAERTLLAFLESASDKSVYDPYRAMFEIINRMNEVVAHGFPPELGEMLGVEVPPSLDAMLDMPMQELNFWYGDMFAGSAKLVVDARKTAERLLSAEEADHKELLRRLHDVEGLMLAEGVVHANRKAARTETRG
ncbi:MAG: hypothetical protein KDB82_14905 [Planctomycetes bacterium]|nr:hypothetical protein [Planctomycetota bacterium]